jgi:hypothetical protein
MKKYILVIAIVAGLVILGSSTNTLFAGSEPGGGGIGGNSYLEVAGDEGPGGGGIGGNSTDTPTYTTYSIPGGGGIGGN